MTSVLLISLYDEFNLGIRQLAAELREQGHETYVLFFKSYGKKILESDEEPQPHWQVELTPDGKRRVLPYPYPISPSEWELFRNFLLATKPHFVGLSVYTPLVNENIEVASFIKRVLPETIVGWGGPHVTLTPQESAALCDVAFVGESDISLIEFLRALHKGEDWRNTPNIVWKEEGKLHRRPFTEFVKDLDTLPFPYYGDEGVYYLDRDCMSQGKPLDSKDLSTYYKIITSRGCPYACTYCAVSAYKEYIPDNVRLRFRSVSHCMRELEEAKARMGHFYVEIEDDIFTLRPERMRSFFEEYSRRIAMPFWCYTHPNYARREPLEILKENHVEFVIMGIQSGSNRIATQIFDRRVTNEEVLKATRTIKELGIRAFYDLISNNPFETEDDRIETFHLIRRIPKPFGLQIGVLNFYPNTRIAIMREEQGLPTSVSFHAYRYWNALYHLASAIDISDGDANDLLSNQFLRQNPSLLESIAGTAVHLTRESLDAKTLAENHLREVNRLAQRVRELEAELHYIKCRRGLKQFLAFSDTLRTLKRRLAS